MNEPEKAFFWRQKDCSCGKWTGTITDDFSIYKWVKPMRLLSKLFSIDGHYKRIKNSLLTELPEGRFKFEYLYHNVGYCSIITKLFSNGYIILDADIDYVEFEWIC